MLAALLAEWSVASLVVHWAVMLAGWLAELRAVNLAAYWAESMVEY